MEEVTVVAVITMETIIGVAAGTTMVTIIGVSQGTTMATTIGVEVMEEVIISHKTTKVVDTHSTQINQINNKLIRLTK